jgi:hypothetical protein
MMAKKSSDDLLQEFEANRKDPCLLRIIDLKIELTNHDRFLAAHYLLEAAVAS